MPPGLRLSGEGLEAHGVYLIDNGMLLLMWIGKQVPPQLLLDLLNVQVRMPKEPCTRAL